MMLSPTIRKIFLCMYIFVRVLTILFRFFFHYSGHGGRVSDIHSDEDDSFDETIYPLDFDQFEGESGQIKDDVMFLNHISVN